MSDSIVLWKRVIEITESVCKKFGLQYGKIVPETRKRVTNKGECFVCDPCFNRYRKLDVKKSTPKLAKCKHKIVHIRVHHIHKPNKPLTWKRILGILSHELAHLHPDGWEHGKNHNQLTKDILNFLKTEGHYQ